LLNALDALGTHREAVVIVGAQAIYVRGLANPAEISASFELLTNDLVELLK
jgi:hypothetical protein